MRRSIAPSRRHAARNSFNDFRKPHMARGDVMWGGMAVVISPNVPKEHIADELIPVQYDWLHCLIYKFFTGRVSPPKRFRRGAKIEREQAFQMAAKLFISPAGWEELKRSTVSRPHCGGAEKC